MKIAFIHPRAALLPEIAAYRRYFGQRHCETLEMSPRELGSVPADIYWHFMGHHWKRPSGPCLVVHEYASLSTPPLRKIKDLAKFHFNCRPDYRLFLNPYVEGELGFRDGIPWGYRDMFCQSGPSPLQAPEKEFDFIYAGTLHASRHPERWLSRFTRGPLSGHSLLILSHGYGKWQKALQAYPHIRFAGPVPPEQVGDYIRRSRFALDIQPNQAPFCHQTSSKFLEYAACGVPVITTGNAWLQAFRSQYGGNYFILDKALSNFNWEEINRFSYSFPNLREWQLEYQLKRSGVCDFLFGKTGHPAFRMDQA